MLAAAAPAVTRALSRREQLWTARHGARGSSRRPGSACRSYEAGTGHPATLSSFVPCERSSAMKQAPHQLESTGGGAVLYMALELSARRWQLAFGLGLATPSRRRTIDAGDREALRREIAAAKRRFALPPTVVTRSCYEAGRDAFWVHRLLEAEAVANVVVASASIEVSRRQRRAKTDRLDAEALLRRLIRYWLGERDQWKVVQVPTVELEDARHAERAIATLVAERTRYRSRIHSLLATHGVRVRIPARLGEHLPLLTNRDGRVLPPGVLGRGAPRG